MADKVKVLCPGVVVDIFRHGHAESVPIDFERMLSEKGIKQALALGERLPRYEVVLMSAAPRAQDTAVLAVSNNFDMWCPGFGRDLYAPTDDKDFAKLFEFIEELPKRGFDPLRYGDYLKCDTTGVFARFKEECLERIFHHPRVLRARRIAIFDHAICGNAIADALFPQHHGALLDIRLEPCDGIRLTATSCEYIPLAT